MLLKKASGTDRVSVFTIHSLREQLKGEKAFEWNDLFTVISHADSTLKLLFFREHMEGKPAAAGKNSSNKEASNTEATLPSNCFKNTSEGGLCGTNSYSYSPQPKKYEKLIYRRSVIRSYMN